MTLLLDYLRLLDGRWFRICLHSIADILNILTAFLSLLHRNNWRTLALAAITALGSPFSLQPHHCKYYLFSPLQFHRSSCCLAAAAYASTLLRHTRSLFSAVVTDAAVEQLNEGTVNAVAVRGGARLPCQDCITARKPYITETRKLNTPQAFAK